MSADSLAAGFSLWSQTMVLEYLHCCPTPAGAPLAEAPLAEGVADTLRAAGVPVTQDRAQGFLEAVSLVGLGDARATYDAGRAGRSVGRVRRRARARPSARCAAR